MMSKFLILLALLNGSFAYAKSGSGGGTMPQGSINNFFLQVQDGPALGLSKQQTSRLNSLFHKSNTQKNLSDNPFLSLSIASFLAFETDEAEIAQYKAFLIDHVALEMLTKEPSLDEEDVLAVVSELYEFLYSQRQTNFL